MWITEAVPVFGEYMEGTGIECDCQLLLVSA